ncbi:hypothetical protein L1887_05754 [Cichorium endivia]|nr:hypothetical protein L1887_05754 [Cichorium endivia]
MEDKETASDRIQHRNVVDMLRDDQAPGSKKNWKAFRDRLRLKRAGKAWTSSVPIPASDLPINTNTNRMMIRRGSSRYPTDPNVDELDGEATRQLGYMPERQRSSRLLPVETDPEEEGGNNPPDGEKKPAAEGDPHMSLMTLLSGHGSNYVADVEGHVEKHQEEPEPEPEEEDIGDYNLCCQCKAKHKNTAFGPCGHTFCKHCTKELHISIGNCPTCSNYMLEILDIY